MTILIFKYDQFFIYFLLTHVAYKENKLQYLVSKTHKGLVNTTFKYISLKYNFGLKKSITVTNTILKINTI